MSFKSETVCSTQSGAAEILERTFLCALLENLILIVAYSDYVVV